MQGLHERDNVLTFLNTERGRSRVDFSLQVI